MKHRVVELQPEGTIIEERTGPYAGLWRVIDDHGHWPGGVGDKVSVAERIPGPVRSQGDIHHWGWPS